MKEQLQGDNLSQKEEPETPESFDFSKPEDKKLFSGQSEESHSRENEPAYDLAKENKERAALGAFTPEQQEEIHGKQQILSSLAYFIGKDFAIPVELNEPGKGWHWDFKENKIRIDPKDLLEKPMDYLRFVISHEGGHRRISRTGFIPLEVWNQKGFSFMMNALEDPRNNNFVAESYPKFKEQMELAYEHDPDSEHKAKQKAQERLGYQPRFMQAGFEYIRQWFKEVKGEENTLGEDLPEEVREVVENTLGAAQDSWWRYPSREEADGGEDAITQYAKASYEINRDTIWPEFKKLVEKDLEDEKLQELLKDLQGGKGEGAPDIPPELQDALTQEEQDALKTAMEKAVTEAMEREEKKSKEGEEKGALEGGEGKERQKELVTTDLGSLSEELKRKIRAHINALPQERKKELEEKAEKALAEFEKEIAEALEGKLADNPEKKAERERAGEEEPPEEASEEKGEKEPDKPKAISEELKKFRKLAEKTLEKNENVYEEKRRDVLPIIDKLEQDLREIFTARRARKWESGFRTGKKLDIKKRIQEKAKGVPAMESKAWQKRELPQEKDYAISLLVDLSGSMKGEKIDETFKAVIVLAEVLNRLSINTEILGFNDRIHEYQKYGQNMAKEIRESMGSMPREVDSERAHYNDDGWALERASERLGKQKASEKFLIALSDGKPAESSAHPRSQYALDKVIGKILKETDQKLIGLGIGPGTKHVENYYPSSLADVGLEEMARKLADLIREVIANYDAF